MSRHQLRLKNIFMPKSLLTKIFNCLIALEFNSFLESSLNQFDRKCQILGEKNTFLDWASTPIYQPGPIICCVVTKKI